MNFDELKKKWDQQTGDIIKIREESMKKTMSISDSIRKSYKKETIYTIIAAAFLLAIPFFENLGKTTIIIYYLLLLQTILITILSSKRFYVFTQMTADKSVFSSKESLLKIYYELKFAIDTYKSFSYIMIIPSSLLYFILIGRVHAEDWLMKYYHLGETLQTNPSFLVWNLLGLIAFVSFVLFYSDRQLKRRYIIPLEEIKQVLDNFDEE
jgi:hypothetical protein